MQKRTNFVEQLGQQLNKYQIQKIQDYELISLNHQNRQNQTKAKQALMELGDSNTSLFELDDSKIQISRWNSKKKQINEDCGTNRIRNENSRHILRNNLILNKQLFEEQNNMDCDNKIVRSFSTRQIPHLKCLLQKLQTPKNKSQTHKRPQTQRKHSYSQKNIKAIVQQTINKKYASPSLQKSNRETIEQRKVFTSMNKRSNSQNKCPISYQVVTKDKMMNSQYKKIKRNPKTGIIGEINQKQILQSLIKSNLNGNKVQQNNGGSHFNYFSNNFKNESRKRGTLINLLY